MSIQCQICKKEFATQITNSHLKTHNTTVDSYKTIYGVDSLSSIEYKSRLSNERKGSNNPNYNNYWNSVQKKKMSDKKTGSIPWNKGISVPVTERQQQAIQIREEKYRIGDLTREKRKLTKQTKEKISSSIKDYAKNNREDIKKRSQKAILTKKQNGYDFGKAMRGKKHSLITKKKIALTTNIINKQKSHLAYVERLKKIKEANLSLIAENKIYLRLKCTICNTEFPLTRQYFTDSKYNSQCCPTCYPKKPAYRSKAEIEIFDYVKGLVDDTRSNDKTILKNRKEIDIVIPDKKIAIEFNGLYWHCEKVLLSLNKSKNSDYEKMKELESLGYRYIGIMEDEWLYKQEIVKSRLSNILGKTDRKIFARKCSITEVSPSTATQFCEENHIQGPSKTSYRYGLVFDGELVSLMTFSKNNISRKSKCWEISRFCNKLNTTVIGGASKLFNAFVKNVNPQQVISYADRRWSIGRLYENLGFELEKHTTPNYWYIPNGKTERIHRFTLRKRISEPKIKTEKQLRIDEGFQIIYDCGSSKWIWRNKQ